MKFIALKTKDGELKGDIAFFCRILHVSRQGLRPVMENCMFLLFLTVLPELTWKKDRFFVKKISGRCQRKITFLRLHFYGKKTGTVFDSPCSIIDELSLVACSPDMHLLSLCDQLVAELRMCYGDDCLGLLPCRKTL